MNLLRIYAPDECIYDGYPHAWHKQTSVLGPTPVEFPAIKDIIREQADHRCERCRHPYTKGQHGNGQWSPCDEQCRHMGPARIQSAREKGVWSEINLTAYGETAATARLDYGLPDWNVEAEWRILTVHHLNGAKYDCRWFNLAALCQRCHLSVQGKVFMERPYDREHSDWFKIHAAGWYASKYLDEDITRDEAEARLYELLALELGQERIFSMPDRVYP